MTTQQQVVSVDQLVDVLDRLGRMSVHNALYLTVMLVAHEGGEQDIDMIMAFETARWRYFGETGIDAGVAEVWEAGLVRFNKKESRVELTDLGVAVARILRSVRPYAWRLYFP